MFNSRESKWLAQLDGDPIEAVLVDERPVRNLHLIVKATRLCNLRCTYCHAWREGPNQVMPFEILSRTIRDGMRYPKLSSLYVIWHGGETTLLSKRYFRKALWLQERFRIDRRTVHNAIQTNATLIDDEWARFFAAAGFSVGVSLDLCKEVHDVQRPFKEGGGSFDAALRGLSALRRHKVPHGALVVLSERSLELGVRGFLERALATGVNELGLLNVLPSNGTGESYSGEYLPWGVYLDFLRELFQLWHRDYRDRIKIRELDSLLGIVAGGGSRLCIYSGKCMGQYLTIEPDGGVSACDKYVGDSDYCFGNIREQTLDRMLAVSADLKRARKLSETPAERFERSCANYAFCRGGCPHDTMLSRRFGAADEGCCGLTHLIEDMKRVSAYH